MNPSQTLRFKYKLPAISAVLMVLVTFATTAALGYIAYTNPAFHRTRLLTRLLSPEALPIFFWGLTIISLIASLIVLQFAIRTQYGMRYVELGPMSALVPKAGLSMSPITIPYNTITQIQIMNIHGKKIAIIFSMVGESRLFAKSFLTSGEFTTFIQVLQERRHG